MDIILVLPEIITIRKVYVHVLFDDKKVLQAFMKKNSIIDEK